MGSSTHNRSTPKSINTHHHMWKKISFDTFNSFKKKEWVLSKKVASEKKVLIYSSPSLDTEWHLHFKSITIHNVCFEFLYCWRITFIHIMTFIEKFIWVRVFNVADLNLITIVLPNFIHVISSFFFQISIHDSKMT